MAKKFYTTVKLRNKSDEVMRARLVSGGPKVDVKPGDVVEAEPKKAQVLLSAYKKYFEVADEAQKVAPKKQVTAKAPVAAKKVAEVAPKKAKKLKK